MPARTSSWRASSPTPSSSSVPRLARALPAGGAGAWATLGVAWTIFVVVGDRGIERFPETGRTRELVMMFAVIGFSLVVFAFVYFIPWALTSVEADAIADLPSCMRPGGN